MTEINDGGHIFPQGRSVGDISLAQGGMSLRDAAALAALPAIIDVCRHDTRHGDETVEQMFARKAWAMADAFIVARETKET